AFNVIHGTFGEDGQLQSILDQQGVKYTGEDAESSRLAFDKIRTKERLIEQGIPTARYEILTGSDTPSLPLPIVIKTPNQGSSVGVHIVKNTTDLQTALADARSFDTTVLVEEYIQGRELTVGILGEQALPVIEILPKEGFYDWQAKYPFLHGGTGADHACPAYLTDAERDLVQHTALATHRALDLQTYSRVDIILSADGTPYVLELNTIPGMTPSSLLPEAAAEAGIDYPALCKHIIDLSLARYNSITRRATR
ncbi:MAG: D-alanine--D-alanine ligase, partial [Patescibacteria group bacterium]